MYFCFNVLLLYSGVTQYFTFFKLKIHVSLNLWYMNFREFFYLLEKNIHEFELKFYWKLRVKFNEIFYMLCWDQLTKEYFIRHVKSSFDWPHQCVRNDMNTWPPLVLHQSNGVVEKNQEMPSKTSRHALNHKGILWCKKWNMYHQCPTHQISD